MLVIIAVEIAVLIVAILVEGILSRRRGPYFHSYALPLKEVVTRLTEVSIDWGDATDGSLTTIVDTTKNWGTNKWKDAIVEVIIDGISFFRIITSNTDTTLTITPLPAGQPIMAGTHYNIKGGLKWEEEQGIRPRYISLPEIVEQAVERALKKAKE